MTKLRGGSRESPSPLQLQRAHYQGPIPPASEMERYSNIDETLPGRIMAMAERQASHRQAMETKALNSHVVRQLAGMICSFTLGMTGIVGGIVCILKGFSPEGLASMFGSISVQKVYRR